MHTSRLVIAGASMIALALPLAACAGDVEDDEAGRTTAAPAVDPGSLATTPAALPKLTANEGKKPFEVTPTFTSTR